MNNFWHRLARPFFVLAPMEDVTDAAFRRLIAGYNIAATAVAAERVVSEASPAMKSCPHRVSDQATLQCAEETLKKQHALLSPVFFTEFTSADGLALAGEEGQHKLRTKLLFSEIERPIVAQFFTSIPEHMEQAARLAADMGFDGVDINMGCPDRAVDRQQSGAALIKNPDLARELIRAAKRGAGGIPISVKTRLGYNVDELETWLPELLAEDPAEVTIHARTRKELSEVPARWERVARAVEIRDECKSNTLIVGNGDVTDLVDARSKASESGCDGVMIGRGVFGNPWLFTEEGGSRRTPQERIAALIEHITLFQQLLSDRVHPAVMKRHFKAYIHGWPEAKGLRMQLMEAGSLDDALALLHTAGGRK